MEMALVPWTDEQREAFLRMQFTAQDSYYKEKFADAEYKIVMIDQVPIGRLYVLRAPGKIRILDMTIALDHRNAGVGSSLLRELLSEAREAGKTVEIYVESFNPSLRLFERFGFTKITEEGVNFLMEWRPPAGGGE
jgi:ribosomal protein S18 acetylase RimI-like enzyme